MSDIGERIARMETTLIHIHTGVERIEAGQIAHNEKDEKFQVAILEKHNAIQEQIDKTSAETILEAVKVKAETEARIKDVETEISFAKKVVLFIWTPIAALCATAFAWGLKKLGVM